MQKKALEAPTDEMEECSSGSSSSSCIDSKWKIGDKIEGKWSGDGYYYPGFLYQILKP